MTLYHPRPERWPQYLNFKITNGRNTMWKRLIVICLLSGIIVGFLTTANEGKEPAVSAKQDFGGRFLIVNMRPTSTTNWDQAWFEGPSIRRLGERDFLVGTMPDPETQPWGEGAILWIPLSEVTRITAFQTLEALKK